MFPGAAAALASVVVMAALRIHDVQGAGHVSPWVGQSVQQIEGVVTAVLDRGFYMQDLEADEDDATSEGVRVSSSAAVVVGDMVLVDGMVRESRPGCAGCSSLDEAYQNLAITELVATALSIPAHGLKLPPPVTLGGAGARAPPPALTAGDAPVDVENEIAFDPQRSALDFYESLESMRVELEGAVVVGPTIRRTGGTAELAVIVPATPAPARGVVRLTPEQPHAERMFLSNQLGAWLPDAAVGDELKGAAIGIVDYDFGTFKILLTGVGPMAASREYPVEPVLDAPAPDELTVATFNLENLGPASPPAKFARLARVIVRSLGAPDLLAVQEIQDASGSRDDGTVDATPVYAALVDAIVTAGGPRYAVTEVEPEDGEDGGAPGANIRVAALYRSDRGLSLRKRPGAGARTPNAVLGGAPELAYSPGSIAPDSFSFARSRKPLATEWEFRGSALFLVVVHFESQVTDPPLFGRFQPPAHPSRPQRVEQARRVADFVSQILARDAGALVVVAGDCNDAERSAPLTLLEEGGLQDLLRGMLDEARYTEIFEGGAQALDHILVSDALARRESLLSVPHVNADFPDQASDHDPVVARFVIEETGGAGRACTVVPGARGGSGRCFVIGFLMAWRRRGKRPRPVRAVLVSPAVL